MNRRRSLIAVAAAYIVSITVACGATFGLAQRSPMGALEAGFFADIIATAAIFAFSVRHNNSSIYDAYWSVIPPLLGIFWIATALPDVPIWRACIATVLTTVWGVRLTYNWAVGWPGMHHEDWRYVRQRELAGRAYWLVSAAGLHLFPTLLVFAGCIPLWLVTRSAAPFGFFDVAGLVIATSAIAIETIADEQLRAFRSEDPPSGSIMNRGLWAWSRHPNYFGELMFWWGLACFGLAVAPSALWAIGGALGMSALFLFISIPMIDKRHLERRPAYAEHQRSVSRLVPLPPRKSPHAPGH